MSTPSALPTEAIGQEAMETHPFAEEACEKFLSHHSRGSTRKVLRILGQHPYIPLTYDDLKEKTGISGRRPLEPLMKTLVDLATAEPAGCKFKIIKGETEGPKTGRKMVTFTFIPFTEDELAKMAKNPANSTSKILASSPSNEAVVEIADDVYEKIQAILRKKLNAQIPLMPAQAYPDHAGYIRQLVNGASWCFFTENGELAILEHMFEKAIMRGKPLAFRMFHLKQLLRESRYDGFIKQKLEPQVVGSSLKLGLGFCFIEGQFLTPYVIDPEARRRLLLKASVGKRGPIDHYFDPVIRFDFEEAMRRIDPDQSGSNATRRLALASLNERQRDILKHTTVAFQGALTGQREHPMETEELAAVLNCSLSTIRADMKELMGTRLQIGLYPRYRGDNCMETTLLDDSPSISATGIAVVTKSTLPIARKTSQLAELEAKAAAARRDIQAAAELQQRMGRANASIAAAERRLAELRGEIEREEESQEGKPTNTTSTPNPRLGELEQALMQKEDLIKKLQDDIANRDASLLELRQEIAKLKAELSTTKSEPRGTTLTTEQQAILETHGVLRRMMKKADELEAAIKERRAELSVTSRQLGHARTQLEKTKGKLEKSTFPGNDEIFKAEANRLTSEISMAGSRYGILTSMKLRHPRFTVPLYSVRVGSAAYQECTNRFRVPCSQTVGFYAFLEEDNSFQLVKLNPNQVTPAFLS